MSAFQGAYFVVGGVPFAAVIVRQSAVSSEKAIRDAVAFFQPYFPSVEIALAVPDQQGGIRFWGRRDVVDYLASVPQIQWCNYTT
ncbi:hypothetical protein BVH03_22120 [Pseudomonas sp. PA15(2017)]|uniref:hypothetical protein n=1 Tax=Pseudomonas sp. PA15(2017) TaxID=1932111 RepID=UPI00095C6C7C|nr:hypothetical protein [Pseudomonas sp. PA15(2017)]OLU22949.1 hypothetical protein BVH03_22120 [Pseudomonas sp. PA15(2017)]